MLQLVGENIDKHRASYGVEQGRLVPIMRGVLVEAGEDADAVILNHAIRIARYLYPQTYLSGYSAEKLSPTIDGRLFLSGKRGQRLDQAATLAVPSVHGETVSRGDLRDAGRRPAQWD